MKKSDDVILVLLAHSPRCTTLNGLRTTEAFLEQASL